MTRLLLCCLLVMAIPVWGQTPTRTRTPTGPTPTRTPTPTKTATPTMPGCCICGQGGSCPMVAHTCGPSCTPVVNGLCIVVP